MQYPDAFCIVTASDDFQAISRFNVLQDLNIYKLANDTTDTTPS
ncbi:hypothetical protein DSUL_20199 [Desulfovibrionales bacterium]